MHRSQLPRIALVTYAGLPALSDDDRLLPPALEAQGLRGDAVLWNDPDVDWKRYAAVVLRSSWDYHYHPAEFLAWVSALEADGVVLLNPPDVLRWNADKSYLRDLEAAGVRTVPTRWVTAESPPTLTAILADTGWDEAVVKPAVSAAARDTWRVARAVTSADEERLTELVRRGAVLVQPFIDAVATQGELSLIFLDGRYSHAVLKRPKPGDFRVQSTHGGSVEQAYPNDAVVRQAATVLRAAPDVAIQSLYARVDGVMIGNELVLMELELIEPALFLGTHPHAATRLASALARRIAGTGQDGATTGLVGTFQAGN